MRLMAASRTLTGSAGVSWGVALMGTPPNLEVLAKQGVDAAPAQANDLILAVRADTADHAEQALDAAEAMLAGGSAGEPGPDLAAAARPRTIAAAATTLTGANVAVVSVPGPYAALAAHQALSAGLHVLLFSDGVSVQDEAWLKTRAEALGLLVMGPGAGTAVLGGVGLGFANVTPPGPVGLVAAAGTGAQEVLALLSAAGTGVAAVIGVGGRDLTRPVGGRMTASALRTLAGRPDVKVLMLVSKPPDPDVLAAVLPAAGDTPLVVVAQGAPVETGSRPWVRSAGTIDDGVAAALTLLGLAAPDLRAGLRARAEAAIGALDPGRVAVRGVFSGGTLCYQAMLVLSRWLGPIYSNTPLQPGWRVPAPPGGHVCLDAGEEEFTASRPHPMIDAEARIDLLREAGSDPATAVLLLDVVLGHGGHPDPAGVLAPVLAELARPTDLTEPRPTGPAGPVIVAHVLGTDADPQGLAE